MNFNSHNPCPWPAWARWIFSTLFAMMMVCIVFDREAAKLLGFLMWTSLAIAALTDSENRRSRILPFLLATVMLTGATLLAAYANPLFPDVIHNLIKYQVGILWLALLWIALPLLRWNAAGAPAWARLVTATLLAFSVAATLSGAASLFPKDSMKLLGLEIIPYTGMFLLIIRLANCSHARSMSASLQTIWAITILTCLAMAVIAISGVALPSAGDAYMKAGFYRIDADAPGTRRLQFLFDHHNRAGFFLAAGMFISLAGAAFGSWKRILGIAGAVASAIALPFTLTRAALAAAAVGMIMFCVASLLRNRRGAILLLAALMLGLPLLYLTLPSRYQQHIARISNPANYREGAGGSIGARVVIWNEARQMIAQRPWLGFGYGFENFESTARLTHPAIPGYFRDAVHAHNMWLETAAETGLPGMILLLAFTILRLVGLAWAWIAGLRSPTDWSRQYNWLLLLWLCLEITILLYGLTNYTLRRGLGLLTYAIWAGSVAIVIWQHGYKPQPLPGDASAP